MFILTKLEEINFDTLLKVIEGKNFSTRKLKDKAGGLMKMSRVKELLIESGKGVYQGNNIYSGTDWVEWVSRLNHAISARFELFNDGSWVVYIGRGPDPEYGIAIASCRSISDLIIVMDSILSIYRCRAKRPKNPKFKRG